LSRAPARSNLETKTYPVTLPSESESPPDARIAVAIPCYNEAAAIAMVVASFRRALPGAEIVVFDNNSTDGTGAIARELGVRVVDVPEQGKGHAVRAAFAALADFDAVVLTDGDGTYPAEAAPLLIAPVLEGLADMTVGARQPTPGAGAMTLIRGVGNRLIRSAFRLLIGPGNTDLLSGYRAFSRRFRQDVNLGSAGFEIETELAGEAAARGLRIVEISVPYHPRIAGTTSKLRAFRDGRRILMKIVLLGIRLRPWRVLLLGAIPLTLLGVTVHFAFAFVAGLYALAVAVFRWSSSPEPRK
jgi:glycosyltransferase involved in cell wall biosynthesis